ncbi:unnamed protein product [Vitrella brassicaformis CCMP3155]|uniref:Uncharacterized protein n=2 Tax=Vitrella brassicaformis TaxID=1169539 RepID=A0A0G4GGA1_VITBC|nr:unnamed protein product [Vitrella brassicaformis CCMP3155]|eukprot:CEM28654.1 unnamed protein product [Vitrella brassicaformis CCMP3155]
MSVPSDGNTAACDGRGPGEGSEEARGKQVEILTRQVEELQRKLKGDTLADENDALRCQILQIQEDWHAAQDTFITLQSSLHKQIAQLTHELSRERDEKEQAECRVLFLEDRVKFAEDQLRVIVERLRCDLATRDATIQCLELRLGTGSHIPGPPPFNAAASASFPPSFPPPPAPPNSQSDKTSSSGNSPMSDSADKGAEGEAGSKEREGSSGKEDGGHAEGEKLTDYQKLQKILFVREEQLGRLATQLNATNLQLDKQAHETKRALAAIEQLRNKNIELTHGLRREARVREELERRTRKVGRAEQHMQYLMNASFPVMLPLYDSSPPSVPPARPPSHARPPPPPLAEYPANTRPAAIDTNGSGNSGQQGPSPTAPPTAFLIPPHEFLAALRAEVEALRDQVDRQARPAPAQAQAPPPLAHTPPSCVTRLTRSDTMEEGEREGDGEVDDGPSSAPSQVTHHGQHEQPADPALMSSRVVEEQTHGAEYTRNGCTYGGGSGDGDDDSGEIDTIEVTLLANVAVDVREEIDVCPLQRPGEGHRQPGDNHGEGRPIDGG